MTENTSGIDAVRAASRDLVRELGFMGERLAGTDLPPSAVHALIDISHRPGITGGELADRLHLEKSSVSRLLRKLVLSEDIVEHADEHDSRIKRLMLTETGHRRVAAIDRFARDQVSTALRRLAPGQSRAVLDGLRLYADALSGGERGNANDDDLRIVSGYRPGLIARITQMHARYYAQTAGFGQRFESVVATGLAEFCGRLDCPQNALWVAIQAGEIQASIAIDGEDLGVGQAHLRWFIVDDGLRGTGIGRTLLSKALAFVDSKAFEQTHLWTFSGLSAARHLYEAHGFDCVEERPGSQWGAEVLEQRFLRRRP